MSAQGFNGSYKKDQPSDITNHTIMLNFDQVDKIISFFTEPDDSKAIHQTLRTIVENRAITEVMREKLLERLQPNYFWHEINKFSDEEKKQINNLNIAPPMVNMPYETNLVNWNQGSYIIYMSLYPNHLS